jgi:ribose transport system substrate-binding protein
MDQSDEVMKALAAGYVDHTVSQNGWGMGYICPLILMYLSDGWEPITWGKHIDTGYVFITKDNMDSWQVDIEALSMKIISSIETEILKKA